MKDKNMSNTLRQNTMRAMTLQDYELQARALRAQAMREMVVVIGKAPGALFAFVRNMHAKAGRTQPAA